MRWLRPTVPHKGSEAQLDEVVALLEAAAADAPPSRRGDEIRAAVLEEAGAARMPVTGLVPGLAPLALAVGALLLALAIGVGAPAVGSFIDTLLERGDGPSEVPPEVGPSESFGLDEVPMPSDPAIPTREVPAASVEPSPGGAVVEPGEGERPTPAPAVPPPGAPTASHTPTPSPTPWPPGQPPVPVPTPPRTGPPPGTPGG